MRQPRDNVRVVVPKPAPQPEAIGPDTECMGRLKSQRVEFQQVPKPVAGNEACAVSEPRHTDLGTVE